MEIAVWKSLKDRIANLFNRRNLCLPGQLTRDQVTLNMLGFNLSVSRETTSEIPAELSVIIPRAEYRQKCGTGNPPACETEIVYSSITVVIAPRHETENRELSKEIPSNKLKTSLKNRF